MATHENDKVKRDMQAYTIKFRDKKHMYANLPTVFMLRMAPEFTAVGKMNPSASVNIGTPFSMCAHKTVNEQNFVELLECVGALRADRLWTTMAQVQKDPQSLAFWTLLSRMHHQEIYDHLQRMQKLFVLHPHLEPDPRFVYAVRMMVQVLEGRNAHQEELNAGRSELHDYLQRMSDFFAVNPQLDPDLRYTVAIIGALDLMQ